VRSIRDAECLTRDALLKPTPCPRRAVGGRRPADIQDQTITDPRDTAWARREADCCTKQSDTFPFDPSQTSRVRLKWQHADPTRTSGRRGTDCCMLPTIRDGTSYSLDPKMIEAGVLAYWTGPDKETFVAVKDANVLGTYYMRPSHSGGGKHELKDLPKSLRCSQCGERDFRVSIARARRYGVVWAQVRLQFQALGQRQGVVHFNAIITTRRITSGEELK
jgi:hypothetical protein